MRRAAGAWLLGLIVGAWASLPAFAADFGELLKRVPGEANALVMLDVEQLLKTPMAVKEKWSESYEARFRQGGLVVPPKTNRFAVAAQIDMETMRPAWEAWVVDLAYTPSDSQLAKLSGGKIDKIGGHSAIRLNDQLCAVQFQPQRYGLHWPGARQAVARWIVDADLRPEPELSKYLKESVGFAERGAPIILALDLTDMFSAEYIREKLEDSPAAKEFKLDLDATSKQLASIRGVSLGVTVTASRYGKIKVDFAEPITLQPDAAKALLLEILGRHGLMIDEFEEWKVGVSGKQVTLEGTLLKGGFRRVLSLVDAPPSLQTPEPTMMPMPMPNPMTPMTVSPGQADKQKMIAASQEYYRTVIGLLDELRGKRMTSDFYTWGQIGAWFEKYARHIDRLPILNVDPEMLEYGAYIAGSLRDAEKALKGIGPKSRLRQNEVGPIYDVRTSYMPIGSTWAGNYGVYAWQSKENLTAEGIAKSHIRTQEKIQGNVTANTIWQGIEESNGAIRRHMTQKYQVEF